LIQFYFIFFFQAEDGIRDRNVTGVQTCALPILIPEFSEVNGRVFVENWRKRDIAIAVFVGHTPSIAAYRYLSVWHKIEEVKELPAVKNMTAREARGALFNVSGKHADALRKMLFYVEDQDLELPDLVQHCVDDVLHSGVYRFSPTQLLDCLF